MNSDCQFDGGLIGTSDCQSECVSLGCDVTFLANGVCDSICNFEECGYDYGDCGYCASHCSEAQFTNSVTDADCNTAACYYDSSLFRECSAGCTNAKLLNDVCDVECNVSLCNFDYGNCSEATECAPGCLSTHLGDTICQAACDNAACNFDDYDCLCADECFDELLSDGNCDAVCNTEDCNYDGGDCVESCPEKCSNAAGDATCDMDCWTEVCEWVDSDCGCAPDCLYQERTACKEECLVLACDYATGYCTDLIMIEFAQKFQLVAEDFTAVPRLADCIAASTTDSGSCSKSRLATPDCSNDFCNIEECAYTLGQCGASCADTCGCTECCALKEDDGEINTLCLECGASTFQYFTSCFSSCPPGTEPKSGSLNVCVESEDLSTIDSPSVIYLTAGTPSQGNYGSGTQADPYTSFTIAMANAVDAYTDVLIMGSEAVALEAIAEWYEFYSLYSKDTFNPRLAHLTIKPELPGTTATLAVTTDDFPEIEFSGSLTFESIEFTTNFSESGCEEYSCDYCCFEDCPEDYDDFCEQFREENFITLIQSGSLSLYDVTFSNMRTEFRSLIAIADGNLYMENVHFSQVIVSRAVSEGVIAVSCSDDDVLSNCGDITYLGGSVTLLNDGFGLPELGDLVYNNFFLGVSVAHDVTISGVTFEYNLVTNRPLLSLTTFNRLTIQDCTIQYNCLYTGFLLIYLPDMDYTINSNNEVVELLYDHVILRNLWVANNLFASNAFMSAQYSEHMQNILVESCTFVENVSLEEALIEITGITLEDHVKQSDFAWLEVNGSRVQGFFTQQTVTFRQVNVTSNQLNGGGLMELENLGNVLIDSCTFATNSIGVDNAIQYVIKPYILYVDPTMDELEIEEFEELSNYVSIDQCGSFEWISNSYSDHNTLFAAGAYLDTANCDSVLVSSSTFESLTGEDTSESSIVKGADNAMTTFVDSTFSNCVFDTEFAEGMIGLSGSSEETALIRNCTFTGTSSDISKGIRNSVSDLTVEDCVFDSMLVSSDEAACILTVLSVSDVPYSLTVVNTNFTNIHATAGTNAVLYNLQYGSNDVTLFLNVTGCLFDSLVSSGDLQAITLTGSIYMDESSQISNSSFSNSEVSFSMINLVVEDGALLIDHCTFSGLNMSEAIIIRSQSETAFLLTVSNTEIFDSVFSFAIGSDTFNPTSRILTDSLFLHDNFGAAIGLADSKLNDTNSIIQDSENFGAIITTPGVVLATFAEFRGVGTKFISNSALIGGAAYISISSIFSCEGCTIRDSSATDEGGALYAESSKIFFSGSIHGNTAGSSGAFHFYRTTATIQDCEIYENSDDVGDIMNLLSSTVECTRCSIHDNTSRQNGEARITTSYSTASFIDSQLYNFGGESVVLVVSTVSSVFFTGSQVYDVVAPSASYLIYISSVSSCTITNSEFFNIELGLYSLIYVTTGSNVTLTSNRFTSLTSSKGVMYFSSSMLTMDDTYIEDYWGPAMIFTETDQSSVTRSYFINSQTNEQSAGIEIFDGSSCTFDNCTFQNLTSAQGGAVFIETSVSANISLTSCFFFDNSAERGGAVYVKNGQLEVSDSVFTRNSATDSGNIQFTSLTTAGRGGAIMFDCEEPSLCDLAITHSSFTDNYATHNGGALEWYKRKPTLSSNTYSNNSATYGNDIASFPISLQAVNPDGTLVSNGRRLSDEPVTTVESVASGQVASTPLLVAVVDHYGAIIATDFESHCSLVSSSSNVTISGAVMVTAYAGIYNFSSYTVIATPTTSVEISVESNAIGSVAEGDDPNLYAADVLVKLEMRACLKGEVTSRNECIYCDGNTYSIDPSEDTCRACPNNAGCYGGDNLVPDAGYWRSSGDSDVIWPCPNPDACLGSNSIETSLNGECADGYKGNMCQSCDHGYSRTTPNTCAVCPDPAGNVLKLLGIVIGLILVAIFMVRSALNSAYKTKALHSVYFKIFVNYTQLVMITVSFDLDWPAYVKAMFDVQTSAGSTTEQVFSIDCYLEEEEGSSTTSTIYFQKVVFMSVLPLIVAALSGAVWLIVSLSQKNMRYLKEELVTTIIVLVFLVHPNIIKTMFSVVNCTEIEANEEWLVDNMDIECWDSTHTFYAVTIAIPALILWGLVTPALCFLVLHRNRKRLHILTVRKKLGFFFNGYTQREYYWELVILFRKMLILFCSVLLGNISVTVQGLSVMVIVVCFLFLQWKYTPYSHESLNNMEIRSILVSAITIYCGLYYLTGAIDEVTKVILFLLIVFANAYFLVYWLYKLFEVGIRLVASKLPFLRKHCLKGIHDGLEDDLFKVQETHKHITGQGVDKMYRLWTESATTQQAKIKVGVSMKDLFIDVVYSSRNIPHAIESQEGSDESSEPTL